MATLVESFDNLKNNTINLTPKIIVSIIIVILSFIVADWIKNITIGKGNSIILSENSSFNDVN